MAVRIVYIETIYSDYIMLPSTVMAYQQDVLSSLSEVRLLRLYPKDCNWLLLVLSSCHIYKQNNTGKIAKWDGLTFLTF